MWKTIKGFVLGALVASGAWVWFADTHSVIRTSDGYHVIEKVQTTFQDVYVDARDWGPLDYLRNPDIAKGLAKAGAKDAKVALGDKFDQMVSKVKSELNDAQKEIERKVHQVTGNPDQEHPQ